MAQSSDGCFNHDNGVLTLSYCSCSSQVNPSSSVEDFYGFSIDGFKYRISNYITNMDYTLIKLIETLYYNYDNIAEYAVIKHMYNILKGDIDPVYCRKFESILTILIILDNIHDIHSSGRYCTTHVNYNHCLKKDNLFSTLRTKLNDYVKNYNTDLIGHVTTINDDVDKFRNFIFTNILTSLDNCGKNIDDTFIPDQFKLIQDTKISGRIKNLIKEKMPEKINTIGTFMDPHSCSDSTTWNNSFDYLSHINIALLYYQSYFNNLLFIENEGGDVFRYIVVIYVKLKTGKNINSIPCDGYQICISLTKLKIVDSSEKFIKVFIKEACFDVDTKFFSVNKVCEVLTDELSGDILSSDLFKFFCDNGGLTEFRAALLVVTIYILSKGFGDFGQGFEALCLSLYSKDEHQYWCNTFVTTVDTFFFLIATICAFPTIIGTVGGEWDLIITFENKKYYGQNIIDTHNTNCKIQIDRNNPKIPTYLATIDSDDKYDKTLAIDDAQQKIETVDLKIKRYFISRKSKIDNFLKTKLKIHPIVIYTSASHDMSLQYQRCVYALFTNNGNNFMFCDASFLEDVSPRVIYPLYKTGGDFDKLRKLANKLDIISVGEIYALRIFFRNNVNINFFNDFIKKVEETTIETDKNIEDKPKLFMKSDNTTIRKMNQDLINTFFKNFKFALWELIRHLLINSYIRLNSEQLLTTEYIDSLYKNRENNVFSMCVGYIITCYTSIQICILIYNNNLIRITKTYEQIDFCLGILEQMLQNMKKLILIKGELMEKIKEIQRNETSLPANSVNSKIRLVENSIDFIDKLYDETKKIYDGYVVLFKKDMISQKILDLKSILYGLYNDSKVPGEFDANTTITKLSSRDNDVESAVNKMKRLASTGVFSVSENVGESVGMSSKKQKLSTGNSKSKNNNSNSNESKKKRDLKSVHKFYFTISGMHKNKEIKDTEFLEIAKDELFKFMKKHIQGADSIKWFKDVKTATNKLSNLYDEIISLKFKVELLKTRYDGIFSIAVDKEKDIIIQTVEGSDNANDAVDKFNEKNPKNNDCSHLCDDAGICSICPDILSCSNQSSLNEVELPIDIQNKISEYKESGKESLYFEHNQDFENFNDNVMKINKDDEDSEAYSNIYEALDALPKQDSSITEKSIAEGGNNIYIYKKNLPKTAPATKPKTSPTTKPKTSPTTKPKTAPTTKPKTVQATKPKTSPTTKPKTAPANKPKTAPTTKPKTAPTTKPKTSPANKPKTAPTTKPKTAPTTKPKTAPANKAKTAPTTKPKTSPTTKPKTVQATKPKTSPTTKPKTAPATKPKTAPTTKPKTAPATKPKTAPTTKPKTAPANKAK